MIDVKQAVTAALKQFNEVFSPLGYTDVLLEEVEPSEDDRYWSITFGYHEPTEATFKAFASKNYKTVKVDAESGQARAIKIRVLA